MSDVKRRVAKLEARSGGDEQFSGPIIYRPGESQAETLARLGLSAEDIQGPGPVIWLPAKDGWEAER